MSLLRRIFYRPIVQPDWLFALACTWFLGGLLVDGWAHVHLPDRLETFFTPWHGLFYSGFGVCLGILLWRVRQMQRRGLSWRKAARVVDQWALLGGVIFLVGGLSDMLWHELLGVEADIEALLSPTHLVLAMGMTLFVSRELRRLPDNHPLAVYSLTMTVTILLFLTQFGQYTDPDIAGHTMPLEPLWFYQQALPIYGMLFFSLFLSAAVCVLLRRGPLPPGALTFMVTAIIGSFGVMREGTVLLPAAVLAGGAADIALHFLARRPVWLQARLVGFGLPFLYLWLAMLTHLLTAGTWWAVHVWSGVPFMGGAAGLMLTYVVWPAETKS